MPTMPHSSTNLIFQSTPSVGRATELLNVSLDEIDISIHALRGEGDEPNPLLPRAVSLFQSTPSVGRATTIMESASGILSIFQSTPSVGRATRKTTMRALTVGYFNPRPPWGGRHEAVEYVAESISISIHALRGEGDPVMAEQ